MEFVNILIKIYAVYYDERPLLCRVDEAYDVYYKSDMTKDEYYKLNYEGCKIIKSMKEDL